MTVVAVLVEVLGEEVEDEALEAELNWSKVQCWPV